jgi:hypothetical protein
LSNNNENATRIFTPNISELNTAILLIFCPDPKEAKPKPKDGLTSL